MMKMIKLALATALMTGAIFGTCIESAKAGITRTGYSGRGSSQNFLAIDIENFNLFSTTPTGEIKNEDASTLTDGNVGLFSNAIENFTAIVTDEAGTDNDLDPLVIKDATLDLKARLINDDSSLRIEYILLGDVLDNGNSAQAGITELALIIEAPPIDPFSEEPNPFDYIDSLGTDARENAVNSLMFIIENNLLNKVNKIRLVGRTFESDESPEREFSLDVQAVTTTIPESNYTNSLLVLGALSVIWSLKHKSKSGRIFDKEQ